MIDCIKTASISIENNDAGENPYNFNIQAEGDETLNIDDAISIDSVAIYPNPTKNTLFIQGKNIEAITIYSVSGKVVLAKQVNASFVDVSALHTGLYFINIDDNQGNTVVKKFIKQ